MSQQGKTVWSHHAKERWSQRFGCQNPLECFGRAKPAGRRWLKRVHSMGKEFILKGGADVLIDTVSKAVFIVSGGVIITVMQVRNPKYLGLRKRTGKRPTDERP